MSKDWNLIINNQKSPKNDSQVSFVLFCKDVGTGAENTVREILKATSRLPQIVFEVIVVDDGSKSFNFDLENFDVAIKVVRLKKSKGISGAILEGTTHARYENLFPIPGHDMYDSNAIFNVLKLLGSAPIILGCRSNLNLERPFLKRIASRVMRDMYRHFFYYFVGDVHGLICYQKTDIEDYLEDFDGHGQNIRLITNVIANGGLIVQTIAPIKVGHKTGRNVNFRNRYPDPKNTLKVLLLLTKLKSLLNDLEKKKLKDLANN